MRLKTLSLYLTVPLVFSFKTKKKALKRFLKAENRKKKEVKKIGKRSTEHDVHLKRVVMA